MATFHPVYEPMGQIISSITYQHTIMHQLHYKISYAYQFLQNSNVELVLGQTKTYNDDDDT